MVNHGDNMSKTVSVSTKLTYEILKGIDELVKSGEYTSRSEALRDAARVLLRLRRGALKESGLKEQLDEKEKLQALERMVKEKGLKL